VRDPTVAAFLEDRLAKSRYAAIGEFHVYGADADLPVVRRLVALGKEHRLVLHAHSDADAIERLFRQDPDARILWAHSGFDRPDAVRELLRRHRNLWCDLAFRSEHGAAGKVPPEWRALFTEFPDRFMVGTDTFTPERWHYIVEHANWSRAWLAELPPALGERIAWRNAEALFGNWSAAARK
jgi:predicted TIM-barrel fold metal-dependent hydrolase